MGSSLVFQEQETDAAALRWQWEQIVLPEDERDFSLKHQNVAELVNPSGPTYQGDKQLAVHEIEDAFERGHVLLALQTGIKTDAALTKIDRYPALSRVQSGEVLARIHIPNSKGLLLPGSFLQLFKTPRLVWRLFEHSVNTGAQIAARMATETEAEEPPIVTFNISKDVLQNPQFSNVIMGAADKAGISLRQLGGELHEKTHKNCVLAHIPELQGLCRNGFRLLLDDQPTEDVEYVDEELQKLKKNDVPMYAIKVDGRNVQGLASGQGNPKAIAISAEMARKCDISKLVLEGYPGVTVGDVRRATEIVLNTYQGECLFQGPAAKSDKPIVTRPAA